MFTFPKCQVPDQRNVLIQPSFQFIHVTAFLHEWLLSIEKCLLPYCFVLNILQSAIFSSSSAVNADSFPTLIDMSLQNVLRHLNMTGQFYLKRNSLFSSVAYALNLKLYREYSTNRNGMTIHKEDHIL